MLATKLNLAFSKRVGQCLAICIGNKEIDTFQFGADHVVDGIAACPANTDNGDLGRSSSVDVGTEY